MNFEFDPEKSAKNKTKHGISFVEAQELWEDPDSFGFPAKSDDEGRYAIIANYQEKLWVAFYTHRSENIRLISVRRARNKERKLYES